MTWSGKLTLSTMKSIASAILGSTGPFEKFPRTIFFNMKAGINQKLDNRDEKTWWLKLLLTNSPVKDGG